MKRSVIVLLLLTLAVAARAGRPLEKSLHGSAVVEVYRLTADDMRALADEEPLTHDMLSRYVGSYDAFDALPALDRGNYVVVRAEGASLSWRIHTVDDLRALLVDDENVRLLLTDTLGRVIPTAEVRCDGRRMRFDEDTRTYTAARIGQECSVEVDNGGVMHFFEADKDVYRYDEEGFFRRMWHGTKRWFRSLFGRSYTVRTPRSDGFVVFSKPRYRPGDTVRFKAYMTRRGRPCRRDAAVRLTAPGCDTTIMRLTPYRDGFYSGEFVLTESLGLRLDTKCRLSLVTQSGADARVGGGFRYEDYDLASILFSASTDKERYSRREPVYLDLAASDENGMAVYDSHVELVMRRRGGSVEHVVDAVFIPDTVWHHRAAWNGGRTMRIAIPDSAFVEGASLPYEIECTLLDAANERHKVSCLIDMDRRRRTISLSVERGMLSARMFEEGRSVGGRALVEAFTASDRIVVRDSVDLPWRAPIDAVAESYRVSSGDVSAEADCSEYASTAVGCDLRREGDSIIVAFDNPAAIPVWYTLRRGGRIVDRGYGTAPVIARLDRSRKGYALQAAWTVGDETYMTHRSLPYIDKRLTLDVETPGTVYPGKSVTVEARVSDRRGRPVRGADITAWARTSKFGEDAVSIPSYDRQHVARDFSPRGYDLWARFSQPGSITLDYGRWRERLGLDSIEYYRFLYPDSVIYRCAMPSGNGTTQLLPFAVCRGEVQPVEIIRLDGEPCYLAAAGEMRPLRVAPGRHRLGMLLRDRSVEVDAIDIAEGCMTVLSVDASRSADVVSPDSAVRLRVEVAMRPPTLRGVLTDEERLLVERNMILVEDNFGSVALADSVNGTRRILSGLPAALLSGDAVYPLGYGGRSGYGRYYRPPHRVGAVPYRCGALDDGGVARLMIDTVPLADFAAEPGYTYRIGGSWQSCTQWADNVVGKHMSADAPSTDFRRRAESVEGIHDKFVEGLCHTIGIYDGRILRRDTTEGDCRLTLSFVDSRGHPGDRFVIAISDSAGLHSLYYGSTRRIAGLPAGRCRIDVIMRDTTCVTAHIDLRPRGDNCLRMDKAAAAPPDEHALSALSALRRAVEIAMPAIDAPRRRLRPRGGAFAASDVGVCNSLNLAADVVTGRVTDNEGEPVIGAVVRAGEHAVTSDIDGRFRMPYVDGAAMLTVDFLGYESFVVQLRRGYDYNVVLQESSTALEEVCVVAYGTTRKAALTGAANGVKVRGAGRIAEEETADAAEPMVVVDGVPYNGALSDLAADDIVSISMLSDESAERLYGSRAAGGVVVVETRSSSSAADMPEGWREGGSLRADFRDDAFWQPSLTTDADGRVRFEVTYPDDITAWNADFVAVGRRRATAHRRLSVRSFMPLSARLSMPRFALVGDTLTAFGRMTNHTGDKVAVERTIDAGDISSERILLDKSSLDRIPLAAASGDSISVVYRLSTEDGFTDGERRSIPILPRGTLVTRGRFEIIADTLVRRFESSAGWGDVTIYADASGIECLSAQIGRLTDYPYDCNEQLASKLLAHLAHERICKARGIRFDGGHDVRRIIDRLVDDKRRDADGLWGWWSGSAGEMWITQHVVDALAQAESAGYKVRWSRRQLADAMIGRLDRIVVGRDGEGAAAADMLRAIAAVRRLDANADCRRFAEAALSVRDTTVGVWLQGLSVARDCGLPVSVDVDSILSRARRTMTGMLHWGVYRPSWLLRCPADDDVEATLTAYSLLRDSGGSKADMAAVRAYLLSLCGEEGRLNTYLGSRVVATLLDDMLAADSTASGASVEIDGRRYDEFPVRLAREAGSVTEVVSDGVSPIFFTAWQRRREENPAPASEGFAVDTRLVDASSGEVQPLEEGRPVRLEARIDVEADADYVMIEIPIPAGMAYASEQPRSRYETYRERYMERTSIFCTRLPRGRHTFTVDLVPRYAGSYAVEAARAELMYYPTRCGRNASTRCRIVERDDTAGK